jgi:hypothetical protein
MQRTPYERPVPHGQRGTSPRAAAKPTAESGTNPFAVHDDPSRRGPDATDDGGGGRRTRRMAWYRISELHSHPGAGGLVTRGVDLHAHLSRRGWAATGRGLKKTITGAGRLATRRRPQAPTMEGPGL